MTRVFTPRDAYAMINLWVKEATGQNDTIQAINSSSFVSVGETIMNTGTENALNALSVVMGRTFMAVRPYNAKLKILNALNSGMYTNRLRKISFYSKDAQASGAFNTDLHINLARGKEDVSTGNGTNSSVGSQWEQNPPVPLEISFGGQSVWDDSLSVYEEQLKVAFRGESEFIDFMSGIMAERGNDIESQKEAFNRMTLLNKMAGTIDMSAKSKGSVINLTKAFNDKFGTKYTSAELRTTHLKEFLSFFVATFKLTSDYMTNRSANYHWSPNKVINGESYTLLRHTPKDKQRAVLYSPLFTEATAQVMPEIFNPQYLDINNYEGVTFWQNINEPSKISVTPSIVDDNGAQIEGAPVTVDYVVGMLYDVDGVMVDYQLDSAHATPLNARKLYHNLWWHFSKNGIVDFTENCVVFIMSDAEG